MLMIVLSLETLPQIHLELHITNILGIFPSYQVDHQDYPMDYVTKDIEVDLV